MNDTLGQKFSKRGSNITFFAVVFAILFFGSSSVVVFFIEGIEEGIPTIVNIFLAALAFWYSVETWLLRKEASNQLNLLEEQGELFKIQSFESTFFQLLQLHLKVSDNLRYDKEGTTYFGRVCFAKFYVDLKGNYSEVFLNLPPQESLTKEQALEIEKVLIDKAFATFYTTENRDRLGHYFRNFYHLIQFVHSAKDIIDKQSYVNLLRAQLSSHEEMLIFYHAQFYSHHYKIALTGNKENEKFKMMLKEYNLLEGISLDMFLDVSVHVEQQRYDTKHFSIYACEFLK